MGPFKGRLRCHLGLQHLHASHLVRVRVGVRVRVRVRVRVGIQVRVGVRVRVGGRVMVRVRVRAGVRVGVRVLGPTSLSKDLKTESRSSMN